IDVVVEPDGGFLATWTRRLPSDPPVSRVLSRRFDSQGQAVGDEISVTGWPPQARAAAVERRPSSDFVIVWQGKYPEIPGYLSMAGTLLDGSGEPTMTPFQIGDTAASTPLSKKAGDVAVQSDGSFVVAWRSPNYYGAYSDVARFSPAAAPLPDPDFGEPTLNDYLGDWSTRLISTPDDGFLVVWSRWAFWQDPQTTLGWQRFHSDGSLGQSFEIDTSQRGYYTRITRRDEDFVIAWEDEGVVAQRFTFEYLFADGFEDAGTGAWAFPLSVP
ncbi:MAG: hypothetical protein MI919_16170, partial [Holophagales bacterium]|nr:hypothetical protein [Holophagales bacterium]